MRTRFLFPIVIASTLIEVMEIEDGLIKRHCVYWGWFGMRVLERGEHFRKK